MAKHLYLLVTANVNCEVNKKYNIYLCVSKSINNIKILMEHVLIRESVKKESLTSIMDLGKTPEPTLLNREVSEPISGLITYIGSTANIDFGKIEFSDLIGCDIDVIHETLKDICNNEYKHVDKNSFAKFAKEALEVDPDSKVESADY